MAPGTPGWEPADAPSLGPPPACRPGVRTCTRLGHPLTRDVPQLQAHQRPAVPVEDLEGKVHPDGGPVVLGEELVHVALDDAGLAHAELADDQHLEKVFAGLGHGGGGRPPAGLPGSAARHERPRPRSSRLLPDKLRPRAGSPPTVQTSPRPRPRHRLIGHRTRNPSLLAARAGRGKGRGLPGGGVGARRPLHRRPRSRQAPPQLLALPPEGRRRLAGRRGARSPPSGGPLGAEYSQAEREPAQGPGEPWRFKVTLKKC